MCMYGEELGLSFAAIKCLIRKLAMFVCRQESLAQKQGEALLLFSKTLPAYTQT